MDSWSNGYVSDIEYLPGFYVEQTPGHLLLSCLLNGFEPPFSGDRFTYCELGCGQGNTANIIAAANPNATVVAVDFNPAHIARARQAAEAAGLTNIQFFEEGFADLIHRTGLPEFDIVSLHGVWSWIGEEDRKDVTTFLKKAVKPGGLVAVTYNAMPGWATTLPIQHLLMDFARFSHETSDKRVVDGLDFIDRLRAAGSYAANDEALLKQIRGGDKVAPDRAVYLAHEYLNQNWRPLYHSETASMLAEAKLGFIGSATLLETFPDLMLRPDQREILNSVPAGSFRETVKDYLTNRRFRRDVFVRGPRKLTDSERDAWLENVGLAATITAEAAKLVLDVPVGTAELPKDHYHPVFEALAARPHTLRELADLPPLRNLAGAPSMVELAGILAGTSQAILLPWGLSNRGLTEQVLRYNVRATAEVFEQRAAHTAIALPLSGGGMSLPTMDALVYFGITGGRATSDEELVELLYRKLSAGKVPLMKDGAVVSEPEAVRAMIVESVAWGLQHRVPLWKQLGAIF